MKGVTLLRQCVLALMIFITMPVFATSIDKIILFGDSLSDNGNVYALTLQIVPSNPPYYAGRFSNGPTWIEHVAAQLQLPAENFAYGGAVARADYNDITKQVAAYLKKNQHDPDVATHMFVIWIGGNDYLPADMPNAEAATLAVASIQQQIDELIKHGAKNILLLNLPDLGKTPLARLVGKSYANTISQAVKLHNAKLSKLLKQERAKNPSVKFVFFDVTKYFNDALMHPEKYGIYNVTDPCYEGDTFMLKALSGERFADYRAQVNNTGVIKYCGDPDQHFFWDHVHPSRIVHQRIAEAVLQKLKQDGVQSVTSR